jgi:hypothetical protein
MFRRVLASVAPRQVGAVGARAGATSRSRKQSPRKHSSILRRSKDADHKEPACRREPDHSDAENKDIANDACDMISGSQRP